MRDVWRHEGHGPVLAVAGLAAGLLLLPSTAALPAVASDADSALEIVFIDVEGGSATLVVTPTGQSILIDAGHGPRRRRRGTADPSGGEASDRRDADRILAAIARAGLDRLDFLLVTHFHSDHTGGVPELASRIPVETFIDYGEPLGTDRMANGAFRRYEPVRAGHTRLVPQVGQRLPLEGVDALVVSAGGTLLPAPLEGAGAVSPACADTEDHPEDGTENHRSIGVLFQFGAFRFLAPGDLSGNTLTSLVCPVNLVGEVSAYLVAHHGEYDTSIPAVYAALQPQVAIVNNGPTKGGTTAGLRVARAEPALEDLWQLHASRHAGAPNAPIDVIANLDDGTTAYAIRLTAFRDGRFCLVNGRTGVARWYEPR